jgi:hypothetical protein
MTDLPKSLKCMLCESKVFFHDDLGPQKFCKPHYEMVDAVKKQPVAFCDMKISLTSALDLDYHLKAHQYSQYYYTPHYYHQSKYPPVIQYTLNSNSHTLGPLTKDEVK